MQAAKKPSAKMLECCATVKELAKLLSAVLSDTVTVQGEIVLACIRKFHKQMDQETIESSEFAAAVKESKLLTLMVDTLINFQREGQLFEGDGAIFSGSLTVIMLNMTNHSVEVCREFSNIESFFRVFYIELLSGHNAENLGSNENVPNRIYHALGIVFNCYFKNDSQIFARLSDYDELVDCTKPYLKCRLTTLSTVALILIAFAVDEKKADIFQGARQNISFLIGTLKGALTSEKRSCNGYNAVEAAKCIRRLALNDSNKDLLIELNLLPVVKQMLTSSRDEDVSEGIEILFTLSFSKKSVLKIRSDFQEVLNKLQSNPKWRDNLQLQGLLFQLQEPSARPTSAVVSPKAPVPGVNKKGTTEPSAPAKKSHKVMISYNHASKSIVERLYKKLVEAKIEVWVDFKDMKSGSVYQAMANGVESSTVVLLCMTRLYNESNNCRLECEYAHECSKKLIPLLMEPKFRPEGWLGLLTRAELRYDLTETKYPFEEKVQELLAALVGHLDGATGSRVSSAVGGERRGHALPTASPVLPPIQAVAAPKLQVQPAASPEVSQSLRSWDKARVETWCRDNKLPEAVRKRGMTGVELQFLVNTLARSPEYFGRVMESHMGFKGLLDLATFVAALEDLMVTK